MITLFTVDCRQNNKNCYYPHRFQVEDEKALKQAVSADYVCAEYKDNKRSNDHFVRSDCLALDCDNDHSDLPSEWILPQDIAEFFGGVEFLIHYSRSHMQEKNGRAARPKFHVLFPIDPVTSATAYAALKQLVHKIFPYFDEQALDAARFFFGTPSPEVEFWEGTRNLSDYLTFHCSWEYRKLIAGAAESVDSSAFVSQQEQESSSSIPELDTPVKKSPKPTGGLSNLSHTEFSMLTRIPQGQRNSTMHRFALKCLTRYGVTERAYTLFREEAERCDPPLEESELGSVWHSAAKFYKNTIACAEGYIPPEQYRGEGGCSSLKPPDYSDIGQAKVVVREYGSELCYTDGTDYLRYDGQKWNESKQQAIGAMEEFLDLQLADAEDAIAKAEAELNQAGGVTFDLSHGLKGLNGQIRDLNPDAETLKALELAEAKLQAAYVYKAFVMKRRDMSYVLSALAAAKPMVHKSVSDLDSDPFLLNTPGATYDLRFGTAGAQAQEPENYITKITAVDPSDQGRELWEKALETFFCGDRELIDYVQQIVGLAAIGKVFLEAIIISYGEGRNGKSTFWNTISRVLGTYSGQISADALTVGCRRNVKPEMAELKGKRLVIAAELEEGMRLNTSIIKQLCSTDEIFAEKKYRDPFKFVPSHTLVLYTNHLPKVGASDAGTWRRLIVIPFHAKIEGSSDIKNYTDYLVKNAGEAVLQWIIEGAQKVIAKEFRLDFPACVKEAVKAYRDNNDWLGHFLEECCDVDPSFRERSGNVYQEYRDFCARTGDWARNTTDFYTALEQAGFPRHKTRTGIVVEGMKLKTLYSSSF